MRLFATDGELVDDGLVRAGDAPFVGRPALVASPDGRALALGSFAEGSNVPAYGTSSPVVIRRADCAM